MSHHHHLPVRSSSLPHTRTPRVALTVVVGLPGAGKTTRAKVLATEQDAVRLCPDEWMRSSNIDLRDEGAALGARDVNAPVVTADELRHWARDLFEAPDEDEDEVRTWDVYVRETPTATVASTGRSGIERLDRVAAVDRFLQHTFGPGVSDVRPLDGGHWSDAYWFHDGERELVLRVGDHEDDHLADRHAATWSRTLLPVPDFVAMGELGGQHWAVTELVAGTPLEEDKPSAVLLADLLRGIWSVDVPTTGRSAPPSYTGTW